MVFKISPVPFEQLIHVVSLTHTINPYNAGFILMFDLICSVLWIDLLSINILVQECLGTSRLSYFENVAIRNTCLCKPRLLLMENKNEMLLRSGIQL